MDEKNAKDVMKEKLGCGCCVDDRKVLQGRITELEEYIKALRRQSEIDFLVKKELDEKLDKVTADYRALWVNNSKLKERASDLSLKNDELRERLADVNESLKRNIQEKSNLQSTVNYLEDLKRFQAKEIESLRKIVNAPNGSCSSYAQQGMQSKIAKQANEIKRLTSDNAELHSVISNKDLAIKTIDEQNKTLRDALDQASKDAEDSFKHGKLKGAEELWAALREAYEGRPTGDNQKIFGYYTVGEILQNLSPTWFMTKHDEYKEKEAHDIKIGDEVVVISPMGSDDSDHGIIYGIIEKDDGSKQYYMIGSGTNLVFSDKIIAKGSIRKTGKHFDHVPFDYIG